MSVLAKKLHILKSGGTEETAKIYTTEAECPAPNLKVNVDGTDGYIKLGSTSDALATKGRVHKNSNNTDYAILKTSQIRDFPNEWGAFQSINFTATLVESGQDWAYAWLLHFANGILPMQVGKNATAPTRDDDLYVEGSYPNANSIAPKATGNHEWLASVASDDSQMMVWSKYDGSAIINFITYTDATIIGFNGGHNTVTASMTWSASVSGNTLTIKKNNATFKTYTI